jgi:hypothetical protein
MVYKVSIPKGAESFLYSINFLIEPSLTPKEIEVMSLILEYNQEYAALPKDKRAAYILSSTIKAELKDKLDIKSSNLANILKALKTKTYNGEQVLSSDGVNAHMDIPIPDAVVFKMIEVDDRQPEDNRESGEEAWVGEGTGRNPFEDFGKVGERTTTTGIFSGEHPESGEIHLLQGEDQEKKKVHEEEV